MKYKDEVRWFDCKVEVEGQKRKDKCEEVVNLEIQMKG